ncbi:hypothetical protein FisN_3Lh548 [Fistulifera solaris]|uniref:Helicase-associated domain-containing protein n=1 Tax=Fistulifera solaris TaxID=1519565 RepID=A0A1Z5J998_FISSO|nr:hypothetical protein FisN_3Lh548 [Fistulifera solaris]|eukprot:GAX10341.1 hypothetical protein FisN_3Lh548 [Fistulifera solaris]
MCAGDQSRAASSERLAPDLRMEAMDKTWMEVYQKLQTFHQANGHCRVPKSYEDNSLAVWVLNQRSIQRAGKMRQDREQLLNDLGFIWRKPDTSKTTVPWMDRYHQLLDFKQRNGHAQVPVTENKELHTWIRTQHDCQRAGTLRPDREQLLNELGFVWRTRTNKRWMDMYKRCVSFKERKGNFKVSDSEDKELRTWIHNQRSCKMSGKLGQDKQQLLDKIGFVWVARKRQIKRMTSSKEVRGLVRSEVSSLPTVSETPKVEHLAASARIERVSNVDTSLSREWNERVVSVAPPDKEDEDSAATVNRKLHCKSILEADVANVALALISCRKRPRLHEKNSDTGKRSSEHDRIVMDQKKTKTMTLQVTSGVAMDEKQSFAWKTRMDRPFSLWVYSRMQNRMTEPTIKENSH